MMKIALPRAVVKLTQASRGPNLWPSGQFGTGEVINVLPLRRHRGQLVLPVRGERCYVCPADISGKLKGLIAGHRRTSLAALRGHISTALSRYAY